MANTLIAPGLPGIGYYFGQGVGSGLQQMAAQKAHEMQFRQSVNRFVNMGFSPEHSFLIAQLPVEKQVEIVALTDPSYQQQSQQNNANPSVIDLLEQIPMGQSQLLNTPNPLGQLLGSASSPQSQQVQPKNMEAAQQLPSTALSNPSKQQAEQPVKQSRNKNVVQQPQRSLSQAAPVLNKDLLKQQMQIQKEERAEVVRQQKRADQETLPYYRDILKADKGATENDKRLDRMEHLVSRKGGLPVAAFYKLFKDLSETNPTHTGVAGGIVGSFAGGPVGAAIGGALGGLIQPIAGLLRYVQKQTSPNTEEYEKLTADFIRDAKNVFGARITDADLAAFMQMIPSLAVSDSGKLQIIKNMKNFNEAAHIKAKVMKDIIKENGGSRPANLELLVEERAADELEKLASKFTQGVESVVRPK